MTILTAVVAVLILSFTVGRVIYEGKSESLTCFSLVHFAGYLFCLLMPVELVFVYYLSFYSTAELTAIALIAALAAQTIDCVVGYSFRNKIINSLVGEHRIANATQYIQKYGGLTIFLFNVLPLSSPVIVLVAGMLKYNFKQQLFCSFLGLLIKYIVLFLVF